MKIYKSEREAGLADKILSTGSIVFESQLQPNTEEAIAVFLEQALATKDGKRDGLYPIKSILVSTVWNKNDDVFDKEEVWMARSTPVDKPTNLDHDQKQIIGHITDSFPIDTEGKLITEGTEIDDLPDKYHLVSGAVIYTHWSEKDLVEKVKTLIAEVEEGKKYVSMECVFRGFDYAVITPNNEYRVLARGKETAFLTKHLRAYGGDGTYQGHRIGRLLRNITFSGKGYVDKPANPDSIILKGEDFSFSSIRQNSDVLIKDGVLTFGHASESFENQVEINMADTTDITKKLAESEVSLAKASADLTIANAKVLDLTKSVEDTKAELKNVNDKLVAEIAKSAELVKTVDELNKAYEAVKAELDSVKAAELKTRRISKLVEAGLAKEDAEKKVEKFTALSDEQFEIVAEALIVAFKKPVAKAEEDIDVDPKDAVTPTEATEVIDKSKASETVIKTGEEDEDKLEATRAAIAQWLASKSNKTSEGDK